MRSVRRMSLKPVAGSSYKLPFTYQQNPSTNALTLSCSTSVKGRRPKGRGIVLKTRIGDVGPTCPSLSSSQAPLLAPSPLRTGLEGFPFIRSSTQKRPHEQRGRGLVQNKSDLLDTDLLPIRTTVASPVVCEAAPMAYAIVICFASCIGSSAIACRRSIRNGVALTLTMLESQT